MNKDLLGKFMEYGIGSILTLLIGFITSPIITRIISPEQNGKFSMFNTVTNLLMLVIMLGLDQSYVRYYYEEEEDNRGKLLRTCIKAPILFNVIIALIILIFYDKVSMYIADEKSFNLSIFLVINVFVSIISRFSMLQVRMKQRGKMYSLLNIIMKIANLIFIGLIFFLYKNNYMTLVIAYTCTNILVTTIAIVIERKELFKRGRSKLRTSKKEIIKYGLPLVFSMAVTWIFQSIDKITIKEFSGFAQVGLYSGAMTIISLLNLVQGTFTTFWTPVAFEKYSQNPEDKEFFKTINKIVTVLMLIIAIGLITCKDIIVLLLGSNYREAVFVFPYLVFMPIMYTISETTVVGISFKKQSKYHIHVASVSALFNLIGNLILVPKFGATGAAISTGLSYIVFFIMRTYLSARLYKVDYSLGKFAICTIMVYILAAYSSFYKFNIIIFILAIINLIIIGILYRDTFLQLFKIVKNRVNNRVDR